MSLLLRIHLSQEAIIAMKENESQIVTAKKHYSGASQC